jgi:hypothetical protein
VSSDFASTKPVKARKHHNCDECGRVIEPGETYRRTAGSWEGDFFTNVACGHCDVFRRQVNRADSYYNESYYGGLGEWVANGYYSAGDLPGLTWARRLALYRMSRHFEQRWRQPDGQLRPLPDGLVRGTKVNYWPGARHPEIPPRGVATVISDGPVEFGGTECVRIRKPDGGTDYIALTHIEPIPRLAVGVDPGAPEAVVVLEAETGRIVA